MRDVLAFVTSLRHPHNAHSYPRVLELLEDTLRSTCNQTSDDYRVIVVCNEIPSLRFRHPNVEFFAVDFPPLHAADAQHTGDDAVRFDRGTKCAYGLWKAKEHDPDHVMFFDADDFVSNRIASFVGEHPDVPVWLVNDGYELRDDRPDVMTPIRGWFAEECGTSRIIKFPFLRLPQALPDEPTQADVLGAFGERYTTMFLGSHCHTDEFLDAGTFRSLPFPAAVYRMDNGENHHVPKGSFASRLDKLAHGNLHAPVRITKALREEFGLPTTPRIRT